jgi:hypothetical protein
MKPLTSRTARAQRAVSSHDIAHAFHGVMDKLLEQLRIDIPLSERRSAYRIRVDETIELDFFPDSESSLNVVTTAVSLPEQVSADCLWQLLELNSFVPLHPNVSVAADRKTRKVQIWTRQPLRDLDAHGALRLLKLTLNAVGHVSAVIRDSPVGSSTRNRGTGT